MTKLSESVAYKRGVRAAITWLHKHAAKMNDPHAKAVLNTAAFHMGVENSIRPLPEPRE